MSASDLIDVDRNLSEVASAIFAPATVSGVLQRVVDVAVATIEGCDAAGVFVVEDERVVTAASSDPIVVELDRMQLDTDEGPCLDAVSEGGTFYAEDLIDDERWPRFGPAATAAGIRCVLAFRLTTHNLSALNLYARFPSAYGATDRANASIIATLARVAIDSAGQIEQSEKSATNFRQALRTRELIGQAQGILMERERITADQAFDVLRRASQHLNTKLRDVAQQLVDTGQGPDTGSATPSK